MSTFDLTKGPLPGFQWHCEPKSFTYGPAGLEIVTDENTDFWQRPHEGIRRDNGHFYFTRSAADFVLTATLKFEPEVQYDQCGLMVRVDAENWIKCSLEYENESFGRLGSVVTNRGHSDWATHDVPTTIREVSYRIRRTGAGFLVEQSLDGGPFRQMRDTRLHEAAGEVALGVYACSPKRGGFRCVVRELSIAPSS